MNIIPTVSFIVPIYNVEKYLERCLDSIVKQTYENIEIILIDDGSTDNSSYICDDYAKKDRRIIVKHQKNAGVAAARNAGMSISQGDYITFVDGDDFVDGDYTEKLVAALENNNADIAVSDFLLDYPSKSVEKHFYNTVENKLILVSCNKVLSDFLYRKLNFETCCGKLFRSNIINNLLFEDYLLTEDTLFSLECCLKSKAMVFVGECLYHYVQNDDSITHTKNAIVYFDTVLVGQRINEIIRVNKTELIPAANCLLLSHAFFALLKMSKSGGNDVEKKACMEIIKINRKSVMFDRHADIKARGACVLSYFGLRPIKLIYTVYLKSRLI